MTRQVRGPESCVPNYTARISHFSDKDAQVRPRGEVYKADPNLDLIGMSKDFVKNRNETLRNAKVSGGNQAR